MKHSRLLDATYAVAFTLCTTTSLAALHGVLPKTPGGTDWQAYYDDVADLTWLADANAAGTGMGWATANSWASGLNINGITGWRLPDVLQPDPDCGDQDGGISHGFNCIGSEMGNLFYNVLGGTAEHSITTSHNSNYNLFTNVQSYYYWTSIYFPSIPGSAWDFDFTNGSQYNRGVLDISYAWAVHPGNVGALLLGCVGTDSGVFESPMDKPVTVNKRARVLPFNMMLIDENGIEITDTDIAQPVIQIVVAPGSTDSAPPPEALVSVGKGDDGNQFIYSDSSWSFNLKTSNFSGTGMYTATVISGDPSSYVINPTCEATFYITR